MNLLTQINEKTFVVSDMHFWHENIEEFCPQRKLTADKNNLETLDPYMIQQWNKVIGPDDLVLCLGDLAFKNIMYTKELNGKKILILGNHDRPGVNAYLNAGWDMILNSVFFVNNGNVFQMENDFDKMLSAAIVEIGREKILFSHYPVFHEDAYDRKNPNIKPRIEFLEKIYKDFGCTLNIHGHTHTHHSTFKNAINVSIDVLQDFTPVKIEDILKEK